MTKRMLIDATHAEETRVAVVDGTKLVEYDYESKVRKQLKGSIFLAKITRVEPSLQAAFINFGGNRHAFLPFSEIHPDYFRIPIADREALIAEQKAEMEARLAEEAAEDEAERQRAEGGSAPRAEGEEPDDEDEEEEVIEEIGGADIVAKDEDESEDESEPKVIEHPPVDFADSAAPVHVTGDDVLHGVTDEAGDLTVAADSDDEDSFDDEDEDDESEEDSDDDSDDEADDEADEDEEAAAEMPTSFDGPATFDGPEGALVDGGVEGEQVAGEEGSQPQDGEKGSGEGRDRNRGRGRGRGRGGRERGGRDRGGRGGHNGRRSAADSRRVEVVGGEGVEGEHVSRPSLRRNYKIQEVIKRGQIMLIQVSKEERGNKGAAVTTYLSLPGRYCVLMPNSPRGGGVSRKIASFQERRRMRELLSDLEVPEGMSVILRTAGVSRTKVEIKRDLDYLTRLWDNIRELTLSSTAPALVHEEGNLIRRAIRDIYGRDIEDVVVAGDEGFKTARDFMKMMIPSHAKRVVEYNDPMPMFHRYQVENQITQMSEAQVTLKSGGYLIINQTEALVAVDVNSGRATKERHIEETALKTNLEAADEVARQLRLRDLGGLVVVDFIDMEDRRNNRKVEQRFRDALSTDRARIQIGRISSFGLLELSRQRLNPSLNEAQFEKCPHCKGNGTVRTVDSAAILVLRALQEEAFRARAVEMHLHIAAPVAIYILNHKRDMVADIEAKYGIRVMIRIDDSLAPAGYRIDAVRAPAGERDEDERPVREGRDNHREGREGGRERGGRDRSRDRNRDREQVPDVAEADADVEAEVEAVEGSTQEAREERGPQGPREEGGEGARRRRGRRGGRRRRGGRDRQEGGEGQSGPRSEFGGEEGGDEPNFNVRQPDEAEFGEEEGNEPNFNVEGAHERSAALEDGRNEGARRRRGGRGRGRGGRDGNREGGNRERGPRPQGGNRDGGNGNRRERDANFVSERPATEHHMNAVREEPRQEQAAPQATRASNDAAPAAPKPYEKVNEQPEQKKKGWWNRLTE